MQAIDGIPIVENHSRRMKTNRSHRLYCGWHG